MKAEDALFALLRYEVCGGAAEGALRCLSPEDLEQLYRLAKKHDLAHLAGDALSKLGVLGNDEISQKLKQAAFQAVYRYTRLSYAYQSICKVLEENKILFIPLKGSVLRSYYPEPWMRTSCDIDILVHEEVLEIAASCLVKELGYICKEKGDHDVSMFSPDGVHLELHYSAVDDGRLPKAQAVLERIWNCVVAEGEDVYRQNMPDDMFYYYHIVHMAKHVENGGCGIRPFLDLWILNHRENCDRHGRAALLKEGGLLTFAGEAEKLADSWFSGGDKGEKEQCFEQFVLDGGVYGTKQNLVTIRQVQQGSKWKYAWQRVFLPYSKIKYHYPILQKYIWLTPVCQIARWFKLLFRGGIRRSVRELKTNAAVSGHEIATTADMLKHLGL